MESAKVRAAITRNRVQGLRQGESLDSVLAIGLQATGGARLNGRVSRNRESDLGNPAIPGPAHWVPTRRASSSIPPAPRVSTCSSLATAIATRTDLGGFSANGMEFVSMGDGARGRVVVHDSTFTRTPGDVLEQLALGTNADLTLRVEDVVASGSTGFSRTGIGNTILIPGNNGDCMLAASGGAGNRVTTRISDTELTDCANNGLTFGSAVANGSRPDQLDRPRDLGQRDHRQPGREREGRQSNRA